MLLQLHAEIRCVQWAFGSVEGYEGALQRRLAGMIVERPPGHFHVLCVDRSIFHANSKSSFLGRPSHLHVYLLVGTVCISLSEVDIGNIG